MKNILTRAVLGATLLIGGVAMAGVASLPDPDLKDPAPLMKALSERHSTREFAPDKLSEKHLSGLLWAASGINRPNGNRTIPSALNQKTLMLFVVTPERAYRYLPDGHGLNGAADKNLLDLIAGPKQKFVTTAPVALVLVGDLSKLPPESALMASAVEAGAAVQSALLYCSAMGLACVPRHTMDGAALSRELGLSEQQKPLMNVVVGYPKK